MVAWTSRVVKIKENLPFRKEFSKICIENRVVIDRAVLSNFKRKAVIKESAF